MKKWNIAICAAFLLPVFAFFIVSLADGDKTGYIEDENRLYRQRPKFSIELLLKGKFFEEYDEDGNPMINDMSYTGLFRDYYADNFPLRDGFTMLGRRMNSFYTFSAFGGAVMISGGMDHDGKGENIFDLGYTDTNQTTTTAAPPPTSNTTEKTETTTTETETTTTTPMSTEPTPWEVLTHPDNGGEAPPAAEKPVDTGSIIILDDRAMEHFYATESIILGYADTVSRIAANLPDVNVYSMFIPTSIEFNAPSRYQAGVRSQLGAMNTLYSNLALGVNPVDTWTPLYAHKDEYTYFRTDHHWTQRGAYYAYTAFAKTAGFEPYALEEYETGRVEGFVGSMYTNAKMYPAAAVLKNNPDYVEYFMPKTVTNATAYNSVNFSDGVKISLVFQNGDKLSYYNKYLIFLGGDYPLVHIKNEEVKNGRKLLVTKDSFGNALVPLLSDHFEEIFVIDFRKFNYDGAPSFDIVSFSQENGVTDILCANYSFGVSGPNAKSFNKICK